MVLPISVPMGAVTNLATPEDNKNTLKNPVLENGSLNLRDEKCKAGRLKGLTFKSAIARARNQRPSSRFVLGDGLQMADKAGLCFQIDNKQSVSKLTLP